MFGKVSWLVAGFGTSTGTLHWHWHCFLGDFSHPQPISPHPRAVFLILYYLLKSAKSKHPTQAT